MNVNEKTEDIQVLQLQLDSLNLVNAALQKQLLDEAEQADLMLRELESQRNELRTVNRLQQDLANRTQRVIDAVSSLVFRLDQRGRVVQANQQGLHFFGLHGLADATPLYLDDWLSDEDIQTLKSQIPPRPWQVYSNLLERVRLQGNYTGHHSLRNYQGEYRQFMLDATVIYNRQGKEDGTVVSAADITELKRLEQDLRQANIKAESAARSKSEFLANMSHEIRTPMNAIVGLSQLAMNLNLSSQLQDYLQKIKSSSDHLLRIINDILDFSKIEAGGMTIESLPFSIDRLVSDIDSLFRLPAEQKGLVLKLIVEHDVPPFVQGDILRIQQILTNLISNAIKFTEKGQVSLSIQSIARDERRVNLLFAIQDQGIGMSPSDREKLFQPFSQADSSISRRFGGTGLGLVISRKLLLMMGSDFQVVSVPQQGSTFSFNLTLELATEEQVQQKDDRYIQITAGSLSSHMQAYAQVLAGKKILVAEDNLLNQQVVREFLQMAGIKMVFARNGREALEQLAQNPDVDAILMDVNMPELSGIEATRMIRQQAEFANLPIIALTAGVTNEEKNNCLKSGMNDFLVKPIDPPGLIARLNLWLVPASAPSSLDLESKDCQEQGMEIAANLQWPEITGIDATQVAFILGGDQTLFAELLEIFVKENSVLICKLKDCLAHDQVENASKIAHKLKGQAANLGATELANAAGLLENALNTGSNDIQDRQKSLFAANERIMHAICLWQKD